MGVALILAGFSLVFFKRKNTCKCEARGKSIFFLTIGVGSSMVPCPPLAAVLVLAARQGLVLNGAAYGLVYGLGLLISPLIIAGGGFSYLSSSMRKQLGDKIQSIERLACLVMVLMGCQILLF
jgi:cytochrome c-type biogenesis protein